MNYYEHHIGDYDSETSHLTWLEDMAYTRLIRLYYRKERPIPADINDVCRKVRATSKQERKAVESVLAEFFVLEGDGWHQKTCDENIEAYQAGEPEREAKKANEENRLKRHREERATLFKALTAAGQHAAWNTGIKELRELVKALPATANPPLPATAPATPATATQTPIPNTQTPVQLNSVPNGTGADAPPLTDDEKLTLIKKEIWSEGKALFASRDIPGDKAGKILGQLLSEYRADTVLEAVRAGVKAATPDPTGYLKACCQTAAGERGKGPKQSRHSGFEKTDYSEGVTEDGRIA